MTRLPPGHHRVRIWDAPVRVIHWLIVVFMALAWWSGESSEEQLHLLSGYAVFALVLVRIVWGVMGSTTARFSHFVRGPVAVLAYARQLFHRPGIVTPGHNPMGALAILLMLGLMAAIVGTGFFADDASFSGPLAGFVGRDAAHELAHIHHTLFEVLLIVVAIHVAVVLFYVLFKGDNLLAAMITGHKTLPADARATLRFVRGWIALLLFIGALALVVLIDYIGASA